MRVYCAGVSVAIRGNTDHEIIEQV